MSVPAVPSNSQAYVATLDTVGDTAWYPNFSATHHLTNSVASMSESTPYSGSGMVYVGNGVAVSIILLVNPLYSLVLTHYTCDLSYLCLKSLKT